jgi:hypothetical protein
MDFVAKKKLTKQNRFHSTSRQGWGEISEWGCKLVSDEKICQNFSDAVRNIFVYSVTGLRKDLHLELSLHLAIVHKDIDDFGYFDKVATKFTFEKD